MGRILILFGICSFILTLISNYFDIVLQIDGKNEITQLGQFWFHFAPNSLQIAESIVSRYVDPCSIRYSGLFRVYMASLYIFNIVNACCSYISSIKFYFYFFWTKKICKKKRKNKL